MPEPHAKEPQTGDGLPPAGGDGGTTRRPQDGDEPSAESAATPAVQRAPISHRLEVIVVIILSVATVCSAWSAYEATRWSGEQAISGARASALRIESTRVSNRANVERAVDVQVFTSWIAAVGEGDTKRADFLRARFREEFKPAFEAWLASVPKGKIPAGTPFTRPEYALAAEQKAEQLVREAEQAQARSAEANQISDNFVLSIVLFTTVLFFAGIASQLSTISVRRVVLALAFIVWVAAVGFLLSLPPNVGF